MIILDEDLLICDLAETYHILDYRGLPPSLVAVLCCGLNENSRIKLKMADRNIDTNTILLASIVDKLALLLWKDSEDAQRNANRPESIVQILLGKSEEKEFNVYHSFEDFEDAWKQITGD